MTEAARFHVIVLWRAPAGTGLTCCVPELRRSSRPCDYDHAPWNLEAEKGDFSRLGGSGTTNGNSNTLKTTGADILNAQRCRIVFLGEPRCIDEKSLREIPFELV